MFRSVTTDVIITQYFFMFNSKCIEWKCVLICLFEKFIYFFVCTSTQPQHIDKNLPFVFYLDIWKKKIAPYFICECFAVHSNGLSFMSVMWECEVVFFIILCFFTVTMDVTHLPQKSQIFIWGDKFLSSPLYLVSKVMLEKLEASVQQNNFNYDIRLRSLLSKYFFLILQLIKTPGRKFFVKNVTIQHLPLNMKLVANLTFHSKNCLHLPLLMNHNNRNKLPAKVKCVS